MEVEETDGVHARLSLSSLTCGRNRNEKLASFFSFLSDARCGSLSLSLVDDHEVREVLVIEVRWNRGNGARGGGG